MRKCVASLISKSILIIIIIIIINNKLKCKLSDWGLRYQRND